MAMSYSSLSDYYNTMFSLQSNKHNKFTHTELENMIPFERDLYITMLIQHIKDLEEVKRRN